MKLIAKTASRVESSTAAHVNEKIYRRLNECVEHYAQELDGIEERLDALDREWDVERTIELNASIIALGGLALGQLDRRFYVLPAIVLTFLLQHSIQGWCPPIPILRRLGFRTAREIDTERTALKALRGDFNVLAQAEQSADFRAREAIAAAV